MSRSNPTENQPNPATRWFEWNGEQGTVRYYDKTAKKNVDVGTEFTFVLLDQMASVGGWHEPSQSGIYSNAVRDTRQEVLLVKSFKGGNIAEGFYKAIKDTVGMAGGYFVADCYIAFKGDDGKLTIGAIKFKGAALSAWMEFTKANRADLYKKAVEIYGFTEGKKGRVVFRVPQFRLKGLSDASNAEAVKLDVELQEFLTAYLKRTKREQAETVARHVSDEEIGRRDEDAYDPRGDRGPIEPPHEDDIPFVWLLPLLVPATALFGGMLA